MSTMKIKPRHDYVLVKRDEAAPRVSEHGIVSAANAEREEKAYGTVVEAGPDVKDLKPGDRVVYGVYAGEDLEVEENGKKVKYRILEDEHIIAFIK